jgi:23S rRNA-/tRNA-specific pseudouridylate synthase
VTPPLDILCEDGPLIAVNKPAGLPTQGVPASVPSLEAQVKEHLKRKYAKPGNVYLGVPHRLDRPVSGVVIFARNSKAAARLAEQFRLRQVRKWYLAVVEMVPLLPSPLEGEGGRRPDEGDVTGVALSNPGFILRSPHSPSVELRHSESAGYEDSSSSHVDDIPLTPDPSPSRGEGRQASPISAEGTLTDWLLKVPDQAFAQVVPEGTPGAKLASLKYRVLQSLPKPGFGSGKPGFIPTREESPADQTDQSLSRALALVLIELETGRMHQIRVQFASRGWPIVGDQRYGSQRRFPNDAGSEAIALHAARLDLKHPIRYDALSLRAPLPANWDQFGFDAVDFDALTT